LFCLVIQPVLQLCLVHTPRTGEVNVCETIADLIGAKAQRRPLRTAAALIRISGRHRGSHFDGLASLYCSKGSSPGSTFALRLCLRPTVALLAGIVRSTKRLSHGNKNRNLT
jgi:hypothetical protein